MRRPPLALLAIAIGLAMIAAAVVARANASSKGPAIVRVSERDFHITLVHGRVSPGTVVFRVTNRGPDEHEFIVIHAEGGLPMRPDGITLDEDTLEKRIVGSVEPAPAGETHDLRLQLKSGRYAVVCNMFGHYMGGMHASLVVQ